MPAAFSVSAAAVRSSQVSGGSTPASSKSAALYQMVDLFDPLNRTAYCLPSTEPTSATDSTEVVDDLVAQIVDRLDRALLGEALHETGLADAGDVGRVPALDRGRQQGGEVVAARRVLDVDVG